MLFIEDSPEEVLEMAMKEEPAIAKAETILEKLGSFDEIRRYYEAREMAIHDEITRLTGARAEGETNAAKSIAMKLLGLLDDQTIAEKTGLTVQQIEEIKGEQKKNH